MKIKIALAKGRVAKKAIALLTDIGYLFPDYSEDSRKLIFTDTTEAIEFFLVKSPDVGTYVEKGAADIGIVGRDVLMEHPAKVYELLNLNIGQCRMCVAGYADTRIQFNKKLTVGTKYPNIAKQYFNSIDQPVDLIMINGSVELAPILGLSDCIVDIVESGSTLRENGLVVLNTICDISSRLIVNQVSLKTKSAYIDPIIHRFEAMAL
ncbi:MAG: ATP phosphoribosyltransferase [Eubacteriaceae bacterium]|nr:ATP phosphoribosyltransferase [Eubacteriaceae bacterium]MDD4509223.1 ATP phosphoribosyltransferase [Eubacteriaceae bacterium]